MGPVLSLVTVGYYADTLSDSITPAIRSSNMHPALSMVLLGFHVNNVSDSSSPSTEIVKSGSSALNGEHDRFREWHLR